MGSGNKQDLDIQPWLHLQSSPENVPKVKQIAVDVEVHTPGTDAKLLDADSKGLSTLEPTAASAVGPGPRPAFLHAKKAEVHAYDSKPSADDTAEEFSFEELRAAKWLAQRAQQSNHVSFLLV